MIGERIAQLRKESGLSQAGLSKKLNNISAGAIGMYETGKRIPDIDKIILFCSFFNVSSDYLLGLSDIRNPIGDSSLSIAETELLEIYNRLPIETQGALLKTFSDLSDVDIAAWASYAQLSSEDKFRVQQIIDTFVSMDYNKKKTGHSSA